MLNSAYLYIKVTVITFDENNKFGSCGIKRWGQWWGRVYCCASISWMRGNQNSLRYKEKKIIIKEIDLHFTICTPPSTLSSHHYSILWKCRSKQSNAVLKCFGNIAIML